MDEAVVVEPQRKITNALRPGRFQFREHAGDQLGVFVRHLWLGPVSDQGPFHRSLRGWVRERNHRVSVAGRLVGSKGFGREQIFLTNIHPCDAFSLSADRQTGLGPDPLRAYIQGSLESRNRRRLHMATEQPRTEKTHRVVIVGAGFGGLETTYRLAGAP